MATRMMIESMVSSFCELFGKLYSDKLLGAWIKALGRYGDSAIATAGHRAMEECSKMPTPMDLIARMPIGTQETETDKYSFSSARCKKCGRVSFSISEPIGSPYLCRECYTGLTSEQIEERFKDLALMIETPEYRPDWAKELDKIYGKVTEG